MTRRVSWSGAEEQRDVVRECFEEWQGLGVGIAFAEVDDRSEAELRIGFQLGDGSWSAVGRDALLAGLHERTMNFGWDLTAPGERGDGPARDRARARHAARAPESVRRNPLGRRGRVRRTGGPAQPLEPGADALQHSAQARSGRGQRLRLGPAVDHGVPVRVGADPGAGAVPCGSQPARRPVRRRQGVRAPLVSAGGCAGAARAGAVPFGTARSRPWRTGRLRDRPAGDPRRTRWAPSATAMPSSWSSRSGTGEPRYLAGQDDGGTAQNATISARLVKGRRYYVRVRLYSAWGSGETAVMCW